MSKDLIKKYLKSLSSLNEDKSISGMAVTKDIQNQEKKINSQGLKDMEKELSDYDKSSKQPDENAIEPVKVNFATDDQKEYHDQMEILNGQEMLRYINEPNKQFKERAMEAIEGSSKMGNNPEWANVVEKSQGFTGPTFGKELVSRIKASAKKRYEDTPAVVQYGDDIEVKPDEIKKGKGYEKVAVNETKNNKQEIKENKTDNKMKRLVTKKPFSDLGDALKRIPENYKVDNKTFEMADGNMNIKIRWEGSLTEGTAVVLQASDKTMINEDIQKMKHLMGYKSQETLGTVKGKDRITENDSFTDIWNKTKKLMTESTDIESVKAKTGNFDDAAKSAPKEATENVEGSVKKEKALPNAPKVGEKAPDNQDLSQATEAKEEIEGSVSQSKDHPDTIKVKTAEFDKAGIKQAPEAKKHIHLKENEETEETDVEVEDNWEKNDDEDGSATTEKEPTSSDIKKNELPINGKVDDDDEVVIPTAKKLQLLRDNNDNFFIKIDGGELVAVPENYKDLARKNKELALNKIIAMKELEAENASGEEIEEGLFGGNDKAKAAKEQEFDTMNAKLAGTKFDQTQNKQKWMERAKNDNYRGQFVIDRGVLQYINKPLMPSTGGSSGFGTANEEVKK